MIPDTEWKFFEATEQRIKHLVRHEMENGYALRRGEAPPWDPAELAARYADLIQDMDYAARVERALGLDPSPAQARHLELHRRFVLATLFRTHPGIAPLAHDLELRMLAFRPRLDGREATHAEIRRVLIDDEDRDRREEAFRAYAPLAESVEEDVAELLARRENLAQELLGAGFSEAMLHAQELELAEVVGLQDGFELTTREAFRKIRGEVASVLGVQELTPWDLDYGLARLSPLPADVFPADRAAEAVRAQARRWGLDPDVPGARFEERDLMVASVRLPLELPVDARYLFRPDQGFEAYRRRLHLAGQAFRDTGVRGGRHLLEQESPVMVEAAGMILEMVAMSPAWVSALTEAPPPAVRAHLRSQRHALIVELRRAVAASAFEHMVYTQAAVDPHKLHLDVLETTMAQMRVGDRLWAADLDLVTRPLTRASRVVAAMVAAQTWERLLELFGEPWRDERVGAWLHEHYFAPGGARSWPEKVEEATGKPLGMEPLSRELGAVYTGPPLPEDRGPSDEAVAEYFKDVDLSDLEDA